jgi:uncharacterized protein HemY
MSDSAAVQAAWEDWVRLERQVARTLADMSMAEETLRALSVFTSPLPAALRRRDRALAGILTELGRTEEALHVLRGVLKDLTSVSDEIVFTLFAVYGTLRDAQRTEVARLRCSPWRAWARSAGIATTACVAPGSSSSTTPPTSAPERSVH